MILYIRSLYGTKHSAKQTRILHKKNKTKQNLQIKKSKQNRFYNEKSKKPSESKKEKEKEFHFKMNVYCNKK